MQLNNVRFVKTKRAFKKPVMQVKFRPDATFAYISRSLLDNLRRCMTTVSSRGSPLEKLSNSSVTFSYCTCRNVPKQTANSLFNCCRDLQANSCTSCSLPCLFMLWLCFDQLHSLCLLFNNPLWLERSLNPTVTWNNSLSFYYFLSDWSPNFIFSISRLVNPSGIRKMLCTLVLYKRGFQGWSVPSQSSTQLLGLSFCPKHLFYFSLTIIWLVYRNCSFSGLNSLETTSYQSPCVLSNNLTLHHITCWHQSNKS